MPIRKKHITGEKGNFTRRHHYSVTRHSSTKVKRSVSANCLMEYMGKVSSYLVW